MYFEGEEECVITQAEFNLVFEKQIENYVSACVLYMQESGLDFVGVCDSVQKVFPEYMDGTQDWGNEIKNAKFIYNVSSKIPRSYITEN